ncbi:MAG: alpha/beta hydrolase [Stecheria intestinalis]|nr:alpha/beta hydrolase [Stecheria intestinalis]
MSRNEKKNDHPVLKTIGAAAAVGTAAYAGTAYYIFREAFDLGHSRYKLPGNSISPDQTEQGENTKFLESAKRSDDTIQSYDGVTLHAMRLTTHPESHKWMIFAHGYHSCAKDMLSYAEKASGKGYNLMMPDSRGCGLSGGTYTGLGWPEHYDLISWIGYLTSFDPEAQIVLFGVSMGASSVMNAAGDYLPDNVKCAIEDSGYSDLKEELIYAADQGMKIPSRPFMPCVDFYVKQFLHFSFYDNDTKRQLRAAHVPMLFLHGEMDQAVPPQMVHECYSACGSEKEIHTFPCGHAEAFRQPEYWETVWNFVDRFIPE